MTALTLTFGFQSQFHLLVAVWTWLTSYSFLSAMGMITQDKVALASRTAGGAWSTP